MADTEMPYTYQPPIESRSAGYIKAGIVLAVAVFLALFIVTESARTSATVMLLFGLAGVSLLVGWALGHKSATRAMEIQSEVLGRTFQPTTMPTQITAPAVPQLPAPSAQWVREDDALFRKERVVEASFQIWNVLHERYNSNPEMRPRPTREIIKAAIPALQSNGMITAAMEHLKDIGLVTGGGQGREYEWT